MKNTKTSSPALSVERSEAERSEDERSATGGDRGGADRPNPEVVAIAKRRIFTAEYKQRILAEADKAKEASGGHRRPAPAGGPVLLSPGDVAAGTSHRNPACLDPTEAWPQVQAQPPRRREPETASRESAPQRRTA